MVSSIIVSIVVIGFTLHQKKPVFAEETVNTETAIASEQTESESEAEVFDDINPTIEAAIDVARRYPDYWSSLFDDGHTDESTTILVLPEGAFLQGQIELGTGQAWDSDTDQNATTVGELLTALRENNLAPF